MDVINVDWLNENSFRNYPLVDGASRVSASGAVLPNGLLADLSIQVALGSLLPSKAFIRKVYGFSAGVVITLGDISNPSVDLATATVFTADDVRGKSYPLSGAPGSILDGISGRITIGLPEAVAQCSMGLYDFSGNPEATRLVASCVRPLLKGISGVAITDASGTTTSVTQGTLTLKAGANITLAYDPVTKIVTVSSAVTATPAQLSEAGCGCDETVEGNQTGIRTINGVPPDANGNFGVFGSGTTTVTTGNAEITISDSSVEPCCGCDQLSELKAGLQAVEDYRTQLVTVAEQLQARISNLSSVVLAAGLNPPSTPPETSDPDCWWYLPVGGGGYGGSIVPCP